MELSTARLIEASTWSCAQWSASPNDAWEEVGVTIDWTPLRTLDHLVDTLFLYSSYVARRATSRIPTPRNGDPSQSASGLLDAFRSGTVILVSVLDDFEEGQRAFHPSGLADCAG